MKAVFVYIRPANAPDKAIFELIPTSIRRSIYCIANCLLPNKVAAMGALDTMGLATPLKKPEIYSKKSVSLTQSNKSKD